MDKFTVFPNVTITKKGIMTEKFLNFGIDKLQNACRFVYELPYGDNSNKDDMMILFKEGRGTCTTKHSVIANLAKELDIPIYKTTGIYAMNEKIVTGTDAILQKYNLPYIPMKQCFLSYESYRIDLTEGNDNGKNSPIENFLFTKKVDPNISEKEEYLIYTDVLMNDILKREEMKTTDITTVLQARQEGIALLKSRIVVK